MPSTDGKRLRTGSDTERYEVEHEPQQERAELQAIYQKKGFSGPLLRQVVENLTADPERWHRAMVYREMTRSKRDQV